MWATVKFLRHHPLTRHDIAAAILRVARYQFLTRTRRETILPWVGGTKLALRRHMKGASGNIYAGLHEFADMGFLIHLLRASDCFIDIGANVGSWTVLASGLCGARTVAIEADPETSALLRRNVEINAMSARVRIEQIALADHDGTIFFTRGLDTTNRIAEADDQNVQALPCCTLDSLAIEAPVFMKIDVEGAEESVVRGARRTLGSPELLAVAVESFAGPVENMLGEAGFQRVWYDPLRRLISTEPNETAANNALFVRDIDECRARVERAPRYSVLGTVL